MHQFWGWLGLNLGKHWIVVLSVGALVTVGLGDGITNLKFALVVLPPLLVWADEKKHRWVTRGLVPDEILDRADVPPEPVPVT